MKKFDPNKTYYGPGIKPSRDWGLICGMALAMLGMILMLVWMVRT